MGERGKIIPKGDSRSDNKMKNLSKEKRAGQKRAGRVYMVYTDVNSFHGFPYHVGLASLASVLIQHGHEVRVGYISSEDDYEKIVQEVLSFEPEVVGFTTVETQLVFCQRLAAQIKAKYSCVTIVGGTHITLWPQSLVEPGSESLDCGMRGESEFTFLDLVQKVQSGEDYHGVENLCYRDPNTGDLVTNAIKQRVESLDDIPHPATEVFDYQGMINKYGRALFHFNRGCPFPCTYCSARELVEMFGTVKEGLQKRSVGNVIEEIKLALERYEMPNGTLLMFTDDLFTLDKKWLYDFLDRYAVEIARPFWCTTRANLVSHELFDRMKSSGCHEVMMSIESGNDFIRNQVMKRGMSKKHLFEAFATADKFDMKTSGPCVIGLPFETPEMIEDSIDTVSQLNVTHLGVNIFYPYRGTPLRAVCEEHGFIPETASDCIERKESILNLPTISKDQILYYHDNWENLVYSRKNLRKRAGFILKSKLLEFAETKVGLRAKSLMRNHTFIRKAKDQLLNVFDIT